MRIHRIAVSLGLLVTALASPGACLGDDDGFGGATVPATPVQFRPKSEAAPPPAPEYGQTSRTGVVLGAANFSARVSTSTWSTTGGSDRFLTSGGALQINPMIPNGAQVERIEIEGCDTSATDTLTLNFGPCLTVGSSCFLAGTVDTGAAATPGCGFFGADLAAPVVMNNSTTYMLASMSMGTTSSTSFSAVRIFYRLNISPAPGVATFPVDVPVGSQFFQAVEALAAAGITNGQGPGTFGVNNPVTRGQAAAFLARALGLHFPN